MLKFTECVAAIDSYDRSSLKVKQVSLCMQVCPQVLSGVYSALPEYILGIDILAQLSQISTTIGDFRLQIRAIKPVLRGKGKWTPVKFLTQRHRPVMSGRQYWSPGEHAEITDTVKELHRVGIIHPTHSPFNIAVWPVHKPDGSWRMTVDYRELKKVAPPIHAAVPNTA